MRMRSGDEDLPSRDSLPARRAKMDTVRAQQQAAGGDEGDGSDGAPPERVGGRRQREQDGEEDEFYLAARESALSKKKARAEVYERPGLLPPLPDPTTGGARKINRAIDKNRGLTRHRNKELKNPRKKHRVKFAEATKRRAGQVQGVQSSGAAGYGGEATGINARVSKSVRF